MKTWGRSREIELTEPASGVTGSIVMNGWGPLAKAPPRPGGNAADLIRAWRDGVTTLWLPDNGRDDLQAERA